MAWALTAYDTQASSTDNPVTMAFDCNGADLLVVCIYIQDFNDRTGSTPTYDSSNMTDSGQGRVNYGYESHIEMWYIVNPSSGSNNISVPNDDGISIALGVSAYTGVNTSDPLDTSAENGSTSAGSGIRECEITTSAAGKLIVDMLEDGESTVPTNNSHTLIYSVDIGAATINSQYTTDDGSSGITLEYTPYDTDDWAMIVCAFNPAPAWALTASDTQDDSSSNPVTLAFDCNGADLLIVGLNDEFNTRSGAVTYDGVNMTDSGQGLIGGGVEAYTEVWYLVNPSSGSNNISIPNSSSMEIAIVCSAWTGVNTSDPLDTSAENHSTGTDASCNITTGSAGKLIVDMLSHGSNDVPSANSHTLIATQDIGFRVCGSQYTTGDGSSGITLTWTTGTSANWGVIVCAFNPAGGEETEPVLMRYTGAEWVPATLKTAEGEGAEWNLTASDSGWHGTNDPHTGDFNCNGADLLVLCIYINSNSQRNDDAPTYNGIEMTDSGQGEVIYGSEGHVEMWYLVNPASGANRISVPNGSNLETYLGVSAWTGVNTSDPMDTSAEDGSASSGTRSCSITTSAAGKLIIDTLMDGCSTAPSANSHTLIYSNDVGVRSINSQYTTDDGSSGVTLEYTPYGDDDWAMIVCAFNPAGSFDFGDRPVYMWDGAQWIQVNTVGDQ